MTGSRNGYARYRKQNGLPGGNLSSVQRAIAAGRISITADGKIDFARADQEWIANTNRAQALRRTGKPLVRELPDAPARALKRNTSAPPKPPTREVGQTYAELQRRRESLRVEREEMELAQKRMEFVPVGPVNAFISDQIVRAKEVLLRIGPELCDRLAEIKDRHRINEMITAEVHAALRKLSHYQPTKK